MGQVKREQGEYGLLIGNDPMKCVQLILLLWLKKNHTLTLEFSLLHIKSKTSTILYLANEWVWFYFVNFNHAEKLCIIHR